MRNLSMKEQDKSTENKAKKNLGYRVFAAILAALSIGIFFIPCISIGPITYLEEFLFKVIGELFGNAPFKAFGFLPSFLMSGYLLNDFATCIFYFFLLCCVITLVLGVVAVFCKKKAPTLLRVATYFFAVGCTLQAAIVVSYYYIEFRLLVLDYFFLAFAACAVLLYFVLACIKLRKGVWSNMALGIFSIIVCVAIGMTAAFDSDSISQAFNAMGLNHDTVKLIFAILGAVLPLCTASTGAIVSRAFR